MSSQHVNILEFDLYQLSNTNTLASNLSVKCNWLRLSDLCRHSSMRNDKFPDDFLSIFVVFKYSWSHNTSMCNISLSLLKRASNPRMRVVNLQSRTSIFQWSNADYNSIVYFVPVFILIIYSFCMFL